MEYENELKLFSYVILIFVSIKNESKTSNSYVMNKTKNLGLNNY